MAKNMHSYKTGHQVQDTAYDTLEIAHILKWTIFSSLFIPPFPTSSMSGSIRNQEDKYDISLRKTYTTCPNSFFMLLWHYCYQRILTIPTTRPCKLCVYFIHVCSGEHTVEEQPKRNDFGLRIWMVN